MGHAIEDVVEADPEGHGREGLRVVRIVCPLPCITEMHVVTDCDHNASLVISNGAPLGLIAIFLVCSASPYILFARDLHFVVDVVEGVKDLIAALKIFNGPIGQNLSHSIEKVLPIFGSMKI